MFKSNTKKLILLAGDIALLYASLGMMLYVRYDSHIFPSGPTANAWGLHKVPFFFVYTLWIMIFYSAGMYDWERFAPRRFSLIKLVVQSIFVGTILAVFLFYFIPAFVITPKTNLFIDAAISTILLAVWRIIFLKTISQRSKIRVLFLGSTSESALFKKHLDDSPALGYKAVAIIDHNGRSPVDLKSLILKEHIDLVIIVPDISQNHELLRIFYEVISLGVTVVDFSEFYESIMGKIPISVINEAWFLENLLELHKRTFETAKRLLDIIAAVLLGIPTMVLVPFIAIAIKLDSLGPVFYYQKRVGKAGKVFHFIKFRSMREGADTIEGFKGSGNDTRHTRIGKILRKTYLDELPQIINVLRGEMSLVGPRPERPEYVEELKQRVPFYAIRLLVKPGITGWAQINMTNDASVEDAPEKLQYDLYYIKNRSIITDITIMLKTASILAGRSGR